jgi:hypothetical protein
MHSASDKHSLAFARYALSAAIATLFSQFHRLCFKPPGGVPSGLSPFLRFEFLDECSEMRRSGSREGVVLVLKAFPNR